MYVADDGHHGALVALACVAVIVAVASMTVMAEGPPPCEPPAGYVPPEVDARIVGLMQGQRVALGSTHGLRAEALDMDRAEWGERFDWYVDGGHVAEGKEFEWRVGGPSGDMRVTLVVSSGDDAVWCHVDVSAGAPEAGPPSWLGPVLKVVPMLALVAWLLLLRRQMSRRREPPGGSG